MFERYCFSYFAIGTYITDYCYFLCNKSQTYITDYCHILCSSSQAYITDFCHFLYIRAQIYFYLKWCMYPLTAVYTLHSPNPHPFL